MNECPVVVVCPKYCVEIRFGLSQNTAILLRREIKRVLPFADTPPQTLTFSEYWSTSTGGTSSKRLAHTMSFLVFDVFGWRRNSDSNSAFVLYLVEVALDDDMA